MDSSSQPHLLSLLSGQQDAWEPCFPIPWDLAPTTMHRWQLFLPTGADARWPWALGPGAGRTQSNIEHSLMTSSKGRGWGGAG